MPEEAATFRTKSQLALEILTELVAESSLSACRVTGDKDYGRLTFWTGWPRWGWATWRKSALML